MSFTNKKKASVEGTKHNVSKKLTQVKRSGYLKPHMAKSRLASNCSSRLTKLMLVNVNDYCELLLLARKINCTEASGRLYSATYSG